MDFKEDFLMERVFVNEDLKELPCGAQSLAIHAFAKILGEIVEENPDAKLSELLSE